jgi:hypothetical protein
VCPGHETSMQHFSSLSGPGADPSKSTRGHVTPNLCFLHEVGSTGHVVRVDISYVAPQAHGIVNGALHQEYSPGIVFIFFQGRKDSIMSKTSTGSNSNEYY